MFDSLGDRLQNTFKKLGSKGKLSEKDIDEIVTRVKVFLVNNKNELNFDNTLWRLIWVFIFWWFGFDFERDFDLFVVLTGFDINFILIFCAKALDLICFISDDVAFEEKFFCIMILLGCFFTVFDFFDDIDNFFILFAMIVFTSL